MQCIAKMTKYNKLHYYSSLFFNSPLPSYKRFIFSEIDFSQKLIALVGAKGVGKTTLLHQYMKSLDIDIKEILYVSMDNPIIGALRLIDIAEEFQKKGGKILLIDEIHYQKDFEKDLKTIYDFFDIKVVFSGSSAIALKSADLSRRAVIYKVPVLSFREFLELTLNINLQSFSLDELLNNHLQIATNILSKLKPLKYFDEYLEYGVYPFFLEGKNVYFLKLTEAINKTIENDLLQIYNIDPRNISILKKLLLILCENPPGSLNISALSRESGINVRTLYNYLSALDKAELIKMIYFNKKGNALLQKPDKIILANPNLFQVLCSSINIGSLRESFFISALYNYHYRYAKKGDYTVEDKYVFEIGGKKKDSRQITNVKDSYLVLDDIEIGNDRTIPLWMFGFLY
jgi:predicted AAA+ superfamily ATPase